MVLYRKLYHISDIHIRLFSRRNEYHHVFQKLYDFLRLKACHTSLIVITGDILHNKIDLQPECTMMTYEFLKELGSIMPTIVIAGNHDALLNNRDRIDSLTSILHERHPPNVFYYPKTGTYRHGNLLFLINSLLDDHEWITAPAMKERGPEDLVIGLYHGQIYGWKNCFGYVSEHGERAVADFEGCDLVLLGDIHKHQYMDKQKRMAYAGSLISQNFGETDEDHGVLVWDLVHKTSHLVRIDNPYAYRQFHVTEQSGVLTFCDEGQTFHLENVPIPRLGNVKIHLPLKSSMAVPPLLRKTFSTTKFQFKIAGPNDKALDNGPGLYDKENSSSFSNEAFIIQYLKKRWGVTDPDLLPQLQTELLSDLYGNEQERKTSRMFWELLYVRFENLFGYGRDNVLDFSRIHKHTVTGIFGKNSVGKSTLIEVLSFMLYGKITRTNHGNSIPREVIHFQEKQGWGEVGLRLGTTEYILKKTCQRQGEKIKVVETFFEIDEHGQRIQLTDEQRKKTDKVVQAIIGPYKTFVFTNLFLQQREESFRDMKQAARKDFLYELFGLDWFEKYRKTKEEEWKTAKTKKKMVADRVEKHSETTWKELLDCLDHQKEQLQKEADRIQNILKTLQETREAELSNMKPVDFSSVRDVLGKQRDLQQNIAKLQQSQRELEEEKANCRVFLKEHNIEELETALQEMMRKHAPTRKTFGDNKPPHDLYLSFAPGYSSFTKKEWNSKYQGILLSIDHLSDLNQEWKKREEDLQKEIRVLLDSKPSFDREKVLEEGKDWSVIMDTSRARNIVQQNELDRILNTVPEPIPSEVEPLFLNFEKEVNDLMMLRCKYEMVRQNVKTDETISYNKKCQSCMSNPHYLQRKEVMLEYKNLKVALRNTEDHCRSLWSELQALYPFPAKDLSGWEFLIQEIKQNMVNQRKETTKIQSRIQELRQEIEQFHTLKTRFEHTQASRQCKKMDAKVVKIEKQILTDPLRLSYEKAVEDVRFFSIYSDIHLLWEKPREEEAPTTLQPEVLKERIEKYHTTEKRWKEISKEMETLQTRLVSFYVDLDKCKTQAQWMAENEKIHLAIQRIETQKTDQDKKRLQLEQQLQETERQRSAQQLLYNQWKEDRQLLETLLLELRFLEMIVKTTERDGLPLFLLQKKLPIIEQDVNALLAPFLDKKLVLCVEEKDVVVGIEAKTKGEKTMTVSNYLGGMESFIIDLALKLGFSKFANLPKSNFFIIDEGISVMDQERISNISHLFDFLGNITDHVFLISHLPSIKDFVNQSIDIVKDDGNQKSRLLITG